MDAYLIPHTKINLECIKILNTRDESMKLFKENTGEKLHGIEFSNNLSDMTPKTQATTTTKNLTGLHQNLKPVLSNDTKKGNERQSKE